MKVEPSVQRECLASAYSSDQCAPVDVGVTSTSASASSAVARVTHYYESRAAEYDQTTYELARRGALTSRGLRRLEAFVASLPAGPVLDVGCGTGWLTSLLQGPVVALDASAAMLRHARRRLGGSLYVLCTSPPLPFPEDTFERVFASNFYSHLPDEGLRRSFLEEALRVATEVVIVEESCRAVAPRESWQERALMDGTSHRVYKRYLSARELAEELAGEVALETRGWIAVRATRSRDEEAHSLRRHRTSQGARSG
jgi:SAM-dependent methyltransferase